MPLLGLADHSQLGRAGEVWITGHHKARGPSLHGGLSPGRPPLPRPHLQDPRPCLKLSRLRNSIRLLP